jgi:hypothetical protein
LKTRKTKEAACDTATRIQNKRVASTPKTKFKLGPPLVGEPWPELEARVETAKDPFTGKQHFGVEIHISRRMLWILALGAALLLAGTAPKSTAVKKALEMAKVLRN